MEKIYNAKIDSTKFYFEDHGCLTFDICFDYSLGGQCMGGYCIGHGCTNWSNIEEITGSKKGTEAMARIMWAVGVDSWEDLSDKYCRIKLDDKERISSIGHIVEDKWLDLQEYMATIA